jgi:hypothetical protein
MINYVKKYGGSIEIVFRSPATRRTDQALGRPQRAIRASRRRISALPDQATETELETTFGFRDLVAQ